jgi:WD40 repeat protein
MHLSKRWLHCVIVAATRAAPAYSAARRPGPTGFARQLWAGLTRNTLAFSGPRAPLAVRRSVASTELRTPRGPTNGHHKEPIMDASGPVDSRVLGSYPISVWVSRWRLAAPLAASLAVVAIVIGSALFADGMPDRIPPSAVRTDPSSLGVVGVTFSPDGKYLATSDGNGHTYVWTRPADRLHTTIADPSSRGASAVAFSPDSRTLAIGDRNGHVYLSGPPAFRHLTDPASNGVTAMSFTTLGHYVAAADANGHTYVWAVAAGNILTTLTDPHSKGVRAVAYSPDGKLLATADGNGHTYIWALPDYKLQATSTDPASKGVTAVAFSPDGSSLATGDANGRSYVYRIGT